MNTVADAHRALEAGVDLLVAPGTEGGGHTGHRALLPLLSEVLTLTERPVVAAGGIATGSAMAALLGPRKRRAGLFRTSATKPVAAQEVTV